MRGSPQSECATLQSKLSNASGIASEPQASTDESNDGKMQETSYCYKRAYFSRTLSCRGIEGAKEDKDYHRTIPSPFGVTSRSGTVIREIPILPSRTPQSPPIAISSESDLLGRREWNREIDVTGSPRFGGRP